MIAYKFLRPGRIAPFSGCVWPEPGSEPAQAWVEAGAELAACVAGVHACRPRDLPYWIADELWEVELDGTLEEHDLKIVATRGRLRSRVAGWTDGKRSEFAEHCLGRVAHHAAEELRGTGLDGAADRIAQAARDGSVDELADAAAAAVRATIGGKRRVRSAGQIAAYVVDAAAWIDDAAGVAYVAAHAADSRMAFDDVEDPFVHERELQAAWLSEALGLPGRRV